MCFCYRYESALLLRPLDASSGSAFGVDADEFAPLALVLKLHKSLDQGEQRVVLAAADVVAGLPFRAALASEDVAAEHCSPPNFLRPSRCAFESRPFLDEPTPFLCAISIFDFRFAISISEGFRQSKIVN